MGQTNRLWRWIAGISGAAILLQTSTCTSTSDVAQQVVIPQIANVLSDTVFFFLDNALVHLTT